MRGWGGGWRSGTRTKDVPMGEKKNVSKELLTGDLEALKPKRIS